MNPDLLNYESGRLLDSIDSPTSPRQQKFFATLFTCDNRYIFEYVSRYVDTEEKDGWMARLLALKSVMLHCIGQHSSANQQARIVATALSELGDGMDTFYQSLVQYLVKISELDLDPNKLAPMGTAIIGDSHTVSISQVINGASEGITYLPGITLRGLSSPFQNSYQKAMLNAAAVHQRKNRVLFSVGEIDQRLSYQIGIKNLANNYDSYLDRLFETLRKGLEKIASLKCPYQEFFVLSLPPFDAALVSKNSLSDEQTQKIVAQIENYGRIYEETAESLGIRVIGRSVMRYGTPHSNLLDHAHFHPSVYESIFNELGS